MLELNEPKSWKKYTKTKDSGVKWLGNIPIHWKLGKLRYYSNLKGRIGFRGYKADDLVDFQEGALTLGAKHVDSKNQLNLENPVYLRWEKYYESPEIMVEKGDVLVVQRGSIGKVVLIEEDIGKATINPSMIILKELKINEKYLYFFLNSKYFQDVISSWTSRTAVPMISQTQLNSLIILIPPKSEQENISYFLDQEVSKIDQLITKKQRLIELLQEKRQVLITRAVTKGLDSSVPMKDSGVVWLGNVPEHWEVIKLKRIFQIVNGSTPKSTVQEYWDGNILWATPSDLGKIKDRYIEDTERRITHLGYSNSGTTLVPPGSLILSTRAPIGHIAISKHEICTNQGCKSLRIHDNRVVNPEYYYYLLFSTKSVLQSNGQGTTFLELSNDNLGSIDVPYFDIVEQERISSFLDQEISKINQLFNKLTDQIRLIEEYRQMLITNAVTGKIDARGAGI